jgi:hypothetical protein
MRMRIRMRIRMRMRKISKKGVLFSDTLLVF